MDFSKHTKEELMDIYQSAVDAYEAGEPIMSDVEYDELVGYLDIENDAQLGSTEKSKSSEYTVKHSYIMGSLDKVHTEYKDGGFNFQELVDKINRHLNKAYAQNKDKFKFIVCTPKYDGCSFSLEAKLVDEKLQTTVASRGDGHWGSDITQHFWCNQKNTRYFSGLEAAVRKLCTNSEYDTLVIRGEALVSKSAYEEKYSNIFANTRVFVSGLLNRDFTTDKEYIDMLNDIDYICYDYRLVNSKTSDYKELSWLPKHMVYDEPAIEPLYEFEENLGRRMTDNIMTVWSHNLNIAQITTLYKFYAEYRKDCPYSLDGIVIKPNCSGRLLNKTRTRPEDMIAVKYVAEKMVSTIVDIEWSVGMTGECYPVGIVEPVYQDGKEITRTSLHGYSYIRDNFAGIGSRVSMVMNGDIIPGVDEVLSKGELKLPDFETEIVYKSTKNVPHLMKVFSVISKRKHSFVSSAKALVIDGIALKTAERIWEAVYENMLERDGSHLFNLMQLMREDRYELIRDSMGISKSTENIISSLKRYHENMTLTDIIRGLCIEACGKSVSEQCARYISGLSYDFTGLNAAAYEWVMNPDSDEYKTVSRFREMLNIPLITETEPVNESGANATSTEQIPIIMTGDPSECTSYAKKSDWLKAHPQYRETTKWKEAKILFTNDLDSTTGKMKKARDNNVEIRQYEE